MVQIKQENYDGLESLARDILIKTVNMRLMVNYKCCDFS